MNTAANPAFGPSAADLRAMNRATTWSIAAHVMVVAALFLIPRDWISERPATRLTITLGGMAGPKTSGTTSIGGRTVEQVVPTPKRPDVIRPVPTTAPAPVPVKAPQQTAKPSATSKPEPPPPTRPLSTGQELSRGNTKVDTGATGVGLGLSGGGGTGGETDLSRFCCPEYLQLMRQRIDAAWGAGRRQPEKGETEIRFTLRRDGTVDKVEIAKSSGSGVLDRASRAAIMDLKMTPLPPAYPDNTLTVRVNFPYEGF